MTFFAGLLFGVLVAALFLHHLERQLRPSFVRIACTAALLAAPAYFGRAALFGALTGFIVAKTVLLARRTHAPR